MGILDTDARVPWLITKRERERWRWHELAIPFLGSPPHIQQRDLVGTLLYDSEFDLGVTSLASVYLLMACGPSNIGTNRLGAARTCHSQDSPPSLLQLGLVIFSFPSVVAS